jgi:hypothetical protein
MLFLIHMWYKKTPGNHMRPTGVKLCFKGFSYYENITLLILILSAVSLYNAELLTLLSKLY